MSKWILLFIAIPVAEVVIYIELGRYVGILPTFALIFGTGIIGVILAKQQGLQTLTRVRQEINAGRIPGNQLLDGLLILIGSVLLITPGLLTDLTGFVLLIPYTRKAVRELLKKRISSWVKEGRTGVYFRHW